MKSVFGAFSKGFIYERHKTLDNDEIRRVSTCFTGTFATRNRGLFMLGVSTGGRISELLSLTIADVYQNRRAVTDLLFDKSIVKGGKVSRGVPVNADGRRAIDDLITWHREHYRNTDNSRPLFPSRHNSGTVSMHRQTGHDVLKKAFIAAGLNGNSRRTASAKTLRSVSMIRVVTSIWCRSCSVIKISPQHRNTWVSTMPMPEQPSKRSHLLPSLTEPDLLSSSLKTTSDENLLRELGKRGYDLKSIRRRKRLRRSSRSGKEKMKCELFLFYL